MLKPFIIALIMLFPGVGTASACNQCGNVKHCRFNHCNNLVFPLFAVPVGVPVYPVAPASYFDYHANANVGYGAASYTEASYSQQSSGGYSHGGSSTSKEQAWQRGKPLVAQHCASCHSGQPGRLNLMGPLTDAQRVNAIGRVMTESTKRMPKDHQLSAADKAGVIAELSMKWDPLPATQHAEQPKAEWKPAPPVAQPPVETPAPAKLDDRVVLSLADLEHVVEGIVDRKLAKMVPKTAPAQ